MNDKTECRVTVNTKDAAFIRDAFHKNFARYADEPLVIYGIGIMTKLVLDDFPAYNIVGLMDETRAGERIYDKPILSEHELVRLGVKRIIIIATANNTNIIFHRIVRFCKENRIDLYSLDGKLLTMRNASEKNFKKYDDVTYETLKSKIDAADAVSFDVFDTLVMRQTLYPRDIFHIVEKQSKLPGFYNARVKSETELHPGESIHAIYDGLAEFPGLDRLGREALLSAELSTERACIVPRHSVVSALKYALSIGKDVYAVSDMYIPSEPLSGILAGAGIEIQRDRLLVSCDFGVDKQSGLFDILRRRVGDRRILHIGDNKAADIDSAASCGIDSSFLLYSAYEMLLDSDMSELLTYTQKLSDRLLIGRFICVQLNDPFLFRRTAGKLEASDNYSLGQSFFAPIILSYIAWLTKRVRDEHFDCLFCSARDAWLIKEIIENDRELYPKFPKLIYYYTSRKTAMRTLLDAESDISEVLKIKHAGSSADILTRNFCLSPDALLPHEGESEEAYIIKHKDLIFAKAAQTKQNSKKYLSGLGVRRGSKVGYIDFTSSGTTQLGLTKISALEVKGLYFLRLGGMEFIREKEELTIDSFFERQSFYYFGSKLLNYYTELENILSSYEATVDDFDDDGKPVFAKDHRSEAFFVALREIHRAVIDYCGRFCIDLFDDCSGAAAELLFSYLHEDFAIQSASYFSENYVYDDLQSRVWKVFGSGGDTKRHVG
jgi:FMN phosphatase YigB (HAD superfamily)